MTRRYEYLDPSKRLVDALLEPLAARVRKTPAGVCSLAHLLIVVPTAQASRRLREALAERFGALLAPKVVMPAALLEPSGETLPEAGRVAELAVLARLVRQEMARGSCLFAAREAGFAEAVDVAAGLLDVWRILGEGGLLMRDVAARAPSLLTGAWAERESKRWTALAKLEGAFFDALHAQGLVFRSERAARARVSPRAWPGIEEVVLPALLSPLGAIYGVLEAMALPVTVMIHASPRDADAFDEWGRVVPGASLLDEIAIPDEAIMPYQTPGLEAAGVADFFAAVKHDEALPALSLADAALFPEVESAFVSRGLKVHNPARANVSASSLGRLTAQLVALTGEADYDVLSAFLRQGDVQRFLASALKLDPLALVRTLTALDEVKTRHMTETLADVRAFATGDLKRLVAFLDTFLTPPAGVTRFEHIREMLGDIFGVRTLDEAKREDREFAAAAESLAQLFEAFDTGVAQSLDANEAQALFLRALGEAAYSLEPDENDVLKTDGWLEIPYLAEDELVVAGFQEGCVPESIVGHAFVPDALRKSLGLTTNDMRFARDAFILLEALRCRAPGRVRLSFHMLAADGSVLKPSRLLFRQRDDAALVRRVNRLYIDAGRTASPAPPRTLPGPWLLELPVPPRFAPRARLSVSALDEYLSCPFTFYLRECFGRTLDDTAEELDAAQFGSLIHDVLDAWAHDAAAREETSCERIAEALSHTLDTLARERFGVSPGAIVALQVESARMRLKAFAAIQAAWRASGWRIVATEEPLSVVYGGTRLTGRADRIDRHDTTGEYRVIDYKTWDKTDRANVFETRANAREFARMRGLPLATRAEDENKLKAFAWRSMQLPVYCAMLEATGRVPSGAAISACYCVLGESAEATRFCEPFAAGDWRAEADDMIRRLLDQLAHGLYWPPSGEERWRYDFAELMFDTPARSVSPAWLDDQARRREEYVP